MAQYLIEAAIERGAPLFNRGQTAACASVYEITAKALLALEEDLPEAAERSLTRALRRMSMSHDSSDQAWIMREGLDEAYAAIVKSSPRSLMEIR
jgi:hypothetical protein